LHYSLGVNLEDLRRLRELQAAPSLSCADPELIRLEKAVTDASAFSVLLWLQIQACAMKGMAKANANGALVP